MKTQTQNSSTDILGIDIGSVSVAAVQLNRKGRIVNSAYRFHQGNLMAVLESVLNRFAPLQIRGISTTRSTPHLLRSDGQYDDRIAVIRGARQIHDRFGTILMVGGERFGALFFDESGNYRHFRTNSSCAAGTGSFLDQQAARLNLDGSEELSRIAGENRGELPKIATRCAVFAKTDLIHAQQEGYGLSEICDGLCFGLAGNIVNTLFSAQKPRSPVLFVGGVSRNEAVAAHLRQLMNATVITDPYGPLYGAMGAALFLMEEKPVEMENNPERQIRAWDEVLIREETENRRYDYPPLELTLSDYPDFSGIESYEYRPGEYGPGEYESDKYRMDRQKERYPVEVDLYEPLPEKGSLPVLLGFDIGSTSTKAVITDEEGRVLAGFYTRTAGQPVAAMQQILGSVDDMVRKKRIDLQVIAAGTTGSGRNLIGKILGADLILDEITAHARAATELRPDADTIIEIGGQDAKFTTLKDGRVTFCTMNTVCAAGTGSFVEEQAKKLDCPLPEYAGRALGKRAPLASDRCTVFMERDINHFLNRGYSADEALVSTLHSVRENYLTKVASEGAIGDTVLFQGATAKNRALVAAFEQRLNRPIHVSRFPHLTGALGAALSLMDKGKEGEAEKSRFRGLQLHQKEIPIRSEVCELCTNHCKLTVARVDRETAAYGFLCGRDYDTQKFVNNNRSGFDLIRARKRIYEKTAPRPPQKPLRENIVVGIPDALHLTPDIFFWKTFFRAISIKTVVSSDFKDGLKLGRSASGAEFCAPMTAFCGHIAHLSDNADLLFLPHYLEEKGDPKGENRKYCYYTQYSSALGASIRNTPAITPLIRSVYHSFHTKTQLYRALKDALPFSVSFFEISGAYDRALDHREKAEWELKALYREKRADPDEIHGVLLGRPYAVLSKTMNKNIPDIFGSLGIKVFFQDMVPENDSRQLDDLLQEVHWHYVAEILKAAETAARTPGAYPILVTSFKCTPDAFAVEYFKGLMESYKKPYLILQLDEHDSSVGYETRIEAAVRAFRNHYEQAQESTIPGSRNAEMAEPQQIQDHALRPAYASELGKKTLLIPNWDPIAIPFVAACLRREGIDAIPMENTAEAIPQSLRRNTGQCIPINILAKNFTDTVEKHHLDPGNCLVWMINSTISCNLGMYAHHLRTLIAQEGMPEAGVYKGASSFSDISLKLPTEVYFAYMFSGMVRKMGCRIRPYEKNSGETDRVIEESIALLIRAFEGEVPKTDAVQKVVNAFGAVETLPRTRPGTKVAIFGDLYARDNPVINQDLVPCIEENRGEAVTVPYSDYVKMISGQYLKRWFLEGRYMSVLSSKAFLTAVRRQERHYYRIFEQILQEPMRTFDDSHEKILRRFNLRLEHTGESMENILKLYYLKKHDPDIRLFVQTSPAFCCPGLITEAMIRQIEQWLRTPIVSITYDGTAGDRNSAIIPYMKYPMGDGEAADGGDRSHRALP